MKKYRYGIIGGTGVYTRDKSLEKEVETEYGNILVDIVEIDGIEVVFLPRHGKEHSIPPHKINYRGNIKALEKLGVEYIYTTAAVGSMNKNYGLGDLVIVDDFLDMTKNRALTFFDGKEGKVGHVDMTDPYCKNMREKFLEKARENNLYIKGNARYVTTEGPRFETAAEIEMYRILRADVVGMTSVPEVVLAKELNMCYATIGIITNWATGIKKDSRGHSSEEINKLVEENRDRIVAIMIEVFKEGLDKEKCYCKNSIIGL